MRAFTRQSSFTQGSPNQFLAPSFWINLLLGSTLFVLLLIGAPFLAQVFGENRLIPLFWLVSPVFLLGPCASQLLALFTRDLQFDWLAKIQIGSLGSEFIVSVTFALWGWGVEIYGFLVI